MNKLTYEIAKWLNISPERAYEVEHEMAVYWGIDFSEATTRELKSVAKMAYETLDSALQ